jgi:DNA-binding IscR family transcriptional regulator
MASLLDVSQKCQYALRALFELALRYPGDAVTTVSEIADTQSIPPRFLEQILSKLRTGRYIEGSDESVDCLKNPETSHCPYRGSCVFKELWERARSSMTEIFDGTTFQNLVDKQRKAGRTLDYNI